MHKIKILMHNDDIEFIKKVQKYFEKYAVIEVISNKCNKAQTDLIVSDLLHELGIPSSIKGYLYIKDAIKILHSKKVESISICDIYRLISKKYNINLSCVERSIRYAIEVGWNRGSWDKLDKIFGNSIDIEKAKPTNAEYITTIAEEISKRPYEVYN